MGTDIWVYEMTDMALLTDKEIDRLSELTGFAGEDIRNMQSGHAAFNDLERGMIRRRFNALSEPGWFTNAAMVSGALAFTTGPWLSLYYQNDSFLYLAAFGAAVFVSGPLCYLRCRVKAKNLLHKEADEKFIKFKRGQFRKSWTQFPKQPQYLSAGQKHG